VNNPLPAENLYDSGLNRAGPAESVSLALTYDVMTANMVLPTGSPRLNST